MKTLIIAILALLTVSGCSSTDSFYEDAELYNRAAGMYCPESEVRTFMKGRNNILFIVCKDGTRFTINGGL